MASSCSLPGCQSHVTPVLAPTNVPEQHEFEEGLGKEDHIASACAFRLDSCSPIVVSPGSCKYARYLLARIVEPVIGSELTTLTAEQLVAEATGDGFSVVTNPNTSQSKDDRDYVLGLDDQEFSYQF
jgi:hypothetical protein